MEKVLIVPDVHGRVFWKDAADEKYADHKIIFLGDYLDQYGFEGVGTDAEVFENFKEIVEFKRSNPDRVVLLLGNHDIHYLDKSYACSRFNGGMYGEYHKFFESNIGLFSMAHVECGVLFTHGGVTCEWAKTEYGFDCDDIDKMCVTLNDRNNLCVMMDVSSYRGGCDSFSGPMWCDIREHYLLTHPDYKQVVGHTMLEQVGCYVWSKDKKVVCCDSRKVFELTELLGE